MRGIVRGGAVSQSILGAEGEHEEGQQRPVGGRSGRRRDRLGRGSYAKAITFAGYRCKQKPFANKSDAYNV